MRRTAVYYRVSTDRQDLVSQRTAVESWIVSLPEERHPTQLRVFQDEGISGKTERRPGFQALLEAAYCRELDTIIVFRLDRLSRNATTAIRLLLNLDDAGVAFISITQPVLNLGHQNPFRRTMLAAFAEIAEIERETIIARVRAGLEAARRRGVKLGAPRKVTDEQVLEASRLRLSGRTFKEIGRALGLSIGTVHRIINDYANSATDSIQGA